MKQIKQMIVLLMAMALCSCATTGVPAPDQAGPAYANDKDRVEMLGHLQKLEDPSKTVRDKAMMGLLKFGPDLEKILPELIEISKTSDGKDNGEIVASFCLDFIGEKADEALIEALRTNGGEPERSNLIRMLCMLLDRPIPSLLRHLKATDDLKYCKDLCVVLASCGYGKKATIAMNWIGQCASDNNKALIILETIKLIRTQPNPPNRFPK